MFVINLEREPEKEVSLCRCHIFRQWPGHGWCYCPGSPVSKLSQLEGITITMSFGLYFCTEFPLGSPKVGISSPEMTSSFAKPNQVPMCNWGGSSPSPPWTLFLGKSWYSALYFSGCLVHQVALNSSVYCRDWLSIFHWMLCSVVPQGSLKQDTVPLKLHRMTSSGGWKK